MKEEKNKLLKRLRRIEGQIRGLQRMIQEDRSCEEIITQLSSIGGALKGAGIMIIKIYVKDCLQRGQNLDVIEKDFHRIIERFVTNL